VEEPLVKFGSTSDLTNETLGVRCTRIEEPLPGSSFSNWSSWTKIAQLIEGVV
jgi:hypothetical protein